MSDPSLLNMDQWIKTLLSSWWSILILAVFTLLEFVGKCVPVVDEMIDSVEVFLIPVLSVFSSLGTLGVLDMAAQAVSTAASNQVGGGDVEVLANLTGERRLGAVSDTFVVLIKVVLVIVGMLLALAIHLFKVRFAEHAEVDSLSLCEGLRCDSHFLCLSVFSSTSP